MWRIRIEGGNAPQIHPPRRQRVLGEHRGEKCKTKDWEQVKQQSHKHQDSEDLWDIAHFPAKEKDIWRKIQLELCSEFPIKDDFLPYLVINHNLPFASLTESVWRNEVENSYKQSAAVSSDKSGQFYEYITKMNTLNRNSQVIQNCYQCTVMQFNRSKLLCLEWLIKICSSPVWCVIIMKLKGFE